MPLYKRPLHVVSSEQTCGRFQAVSSAKRYQSKIHDAQSLIRWTYKCRSRGLGPGAIGWVSMIGGPAPADGAGLEAPPPTKG